MTDEQAGSRVSVEWPSGGRHPQRRPNGWLIPLVAVLVSGSLWSFRGEVTPDASQSIDLDSFELVTTTTDPPLEGDLSRGWVAIDLPGEGAIVEIVSSRFGLFAVEADRDQTSLWRSSDGIVWDLAQTDPGFSSGAEINAIVETELGLVAVGAWTEVGSDPYSEWGFVRERREPAVWLSVDGETWERVTDDQIERSVEDGSPTDDDQHLGAMSDIVVWEGRLVAVGWSSSRNHHGAAWVADLDGRNWKVATKGLTGAGTMFTEVTGVSAFDGGLVAVGSTLSRPSVWASPDAMTWSIIEPRDSFGNLQFDRPVQVTIGGAGLVAVGAHQRMTQEYVDPPGRGYSIVWLSRDSEEWLRLTPEQLDGVFLEDAIAVDPWLVAVGVQGDGYSTQPGVWYSTSGAEWQGVDLGLDGYEWGESTVNAIVRGGPGLVAGGTVQGKPELWLWASEGSVEIPDSAWVRPDPGRWVLRSEFDSDFPTRSIGVTPSGYVAIDQRAMLTSVDGVNWASVPLEDVGLKPERSYSTPVTIYGIAYLVDESGVLWSSSDGRSWVRLAEGFTGRLEGPKPGRNGELLLFEHPKWDGEEDERVRLWRSADGVRWTEVSLPTLDRISGIDFVGDRYVLRARSEVGPVWWVSTLEGEWDLMELDQEIEFTGQVARIGDRLLMPAWTVFDMAVLRVATTSDGLNWDLSDTDFEGWSNEIVQYGSGVAMIVETSEPGYMPRFTMWNSVDGVQWTELGPLPAYRDFWPRVLADLETITVVIESGERSSLWEWVPPAG